MLFPPIRGKTNTITRVLPCFAVVAYFPALCASKLHVLPRLAPGASFPALGTHHVFWLRVLIGSLRYFALVVIGQR